LLNALQADTFEKNGPPALPYPALQPFAMPPLVAALRRTPLLPCSLPAPSPQLPRSLPTPTRPFGPRAAAAHATVPRPPASWDAPRSSYSLAGWLGVGAGQKQPVGLPCTPFASSHCFSTRLQQRCSCMLPAVGGA
jgi:hypothetical protein